MNKLFINLLLILGIHFSSFASNKDTSERQCIYEAECEKAEKSDSLINRVTFDRSTNQFKFDGSRENLDAVWFVDGQRVPDQKLEDCRQVLGSGPTFCYVNLRRKTQKQQSEQVDKNGSSIIIAHTKYNLDQNDSEHEEISKEAMSYEQRINAYNKLTKEERVKQIRASLKRRNKYDQSKIPTHMDPNSAKQ
ncbi:hypothetical protein KBB68_00685 [Candidatus Babeliales bacterium]|nr:hypothetical protein [Candidatus Babeliales bacterium]